MPEPDWQNEKHKLNRVMLADEDCDNIVAWQIDSQEKLSTEMDRNFDRDLTMILEMRTIYTKYLDQANHVDKKCNQIQTIALRLKHELQISNNERQKAITLLEAQVAKSNRYKKIIDMLQNSLFTKPD